MAHVQTEVNDLGSVNNATTVSINTTSGNILLTTCASGNETVSAPTDTYGNTWIPYAGNPVVISSTNYYLFYSLNIIGGANEIVTFAGAGSVKATAISEFSGRSKTAITVATPTTTGASNTQTGPSVTSLLGDDVWAIDMLTYRGAAVTWSPGSGFTIPPNGYISASVDLPICVEYQADVAAGSYTPSFTTNSVNQGAFFAVSMPAAIATGSPLTLLGVGA